LQDTVSIGHKWIFLKWVISLENFFLSKLAGHFNNWSSMDVFEMGYRWFQLFFNDFYIPLPEGGGGYTVLPLSFCSSFRPSKIFFVAFFSVTVDGRNLIFGHKRHIGIPYCG
jgi:hypothetical protein